MKDALWNTAEAVVYCKGISDIVAQEYALEYTRILQNRAKESWFAGTPPATMPSRALGGVLTTLWTFHFRQLVQTIPSL